MFWKCPMMHIQHSIEICSAVQQQSRVLQADWLIMEYNVKATSNINMPFW